MDFRVFVVIEAPILDKTFEMLVPIDRRIHEIIDALNKMAPELREKYYVSHTPNLYNVSTGEIYDMNLIIEESNIKMGTRLLLI